MLRVMLDTAPSGQATNPTTTDLTELNRRLREEASLYKTATGVAMAVAGVAVVGLVVQRFLMQQQIGTARLECYARSPQPPQAPYGYGQYGYGMPQPGYYGQR